MKDRGWADAQYFNKSEAQLEFERKLEAREPAWLREELQNKKWFVNRHVGRRKRWVSDIVAHDDKMNEVKRHLCDVLKRSMARTQFNQREIARQLGTTQSTISYVQNSKVEKLTLNQLFSYLARLSPFFQILVSI